MLFVVLYSHPSKDLLHVDLQIIVLTAGGRFSSLHELCVLINILEGHRCVLGPETANRIPTARAMFHLNGRLRTFASAAPSSLLSFRPCALCDIGSSNTLQVVW